MSSRFVTDRQCRFPGALAAATAFDFPSPVNGSIKRIILNFNDYELSPIFNVAVLFPALSAGPTANLENVVFVWKCQQINYDLLNAELNIPCAKGEILRVVSTPFLGFPIGFEIVVVWEYEREDDDLIGDSAA